MQADMVAEIQSKTEIKERASKGTPARESKKHGTTLSNAVIDKVKPKKDTRRSVAKQAKVTEHRLQKARKVRKASPGLASGRIAASLIECLFQVMYKFVNNFGLVGAIGIEKPQ